MSTRPALGGAIALVWTVCVAPGTRAATFFDFSWTDGGTLTAVGSLTLDDSVGVGEAFDKNDVLAFELELFDGVVSQGMGAFPPFDPVFHALNGMRAASSLDINDLYVTVPFGIRLGCDAGDCLSGGIYFDAMNVDFGSREAAQASFVFTQAPEAGAEASVLTALAALVWLASRPTWPRGPRWRRASHGLRVARRSLRARPRRTDPRSPRA